MHIMKTAGQSTIQYENPPIDEIVCGIRFESIERLRSGHYGILWQKFRDKFPIIEDHCRIGPVSSKDLENPKKTQLPRVWFIHRSENELIQVQRNWFLYNWRKKRARDEYPGYKKVITDFEKYLSYFQEFLSTEKLGYFVEEEYELSYIDVIPRGEGWEDFGDLERVFPNLLTPSKHSILSTNVRSINWQTIIDLPDDSGRLKLAVRSATRISDKHQLLHIEFNALGNHHDISMVDWFDTTHGVIAELFAHLVSSDIQDKYWRRKR